MGRHGENIRLRTDGRWEARTLVISQGSGKKHYKYIYGRSYREAKQRREEFLRGQTIPNQPAPARQQSPVKENKCSDSGVLFAEVAANWLMAKQPLVKESTYIHYTNQVKKHLLPTLGAIPVCEIDSVLLETFLTDKRQSGRLSTGSSLSANSVADIKVILTQILKYARSHGIIPAVPDCPAVSYIQPKINVLSQEEQETLVNYVLEYETPFTLGILIALYAGLRIGEVCALQWGDFNFSSGTVAVNKTVMRIYDMNEGSTARTKVIIDKPKTLSSLRTVPLIDDLAGYFSARKKKNDTFIVTGTEKFIEPRVCLDKYKRLLRRAGLPDYNFHVLRHTFATRCVEKGVDVKSLSEIMGHANVSVTMQRYVLPSMAQKKEQINKLAEPAFRGQDSWSK